MDASEVGKRYGKLTVIETGHRRGGRNACLCQCECRKQYVVIKKHLVSGKTKSCGCSKREDASNRFWKGVGEIPRHYYCIVKSNAAARKIKFSITLEEMWGLFLTQKRKCALTGVMLKFRGRNSRRREPDYDQTASLDRIDSSEGYEIGNVQWVHKTINLMKFSLAEKELNDWVKIIYEFQNSKTNPTP